MISSNIKVLQINLNRSQAATESALQIAIELKAELIIVQEPWIYTPNSSNYNGCRSVLHQGSGWRSTQFNSTWRLRGWN
jgi:hypothetical protein